MTTSAAPGAEFDPAADVRPCSVASGAKISIKVWTVRGIFTLFSIQYRLLALRFYHSVKTVPTNALMFSNPFLKQ